MGKVMGKVTENMIKNLQESLQMRWLGKLRRYYGKEGYKESYRGGDKKVIGEITERL